MKNAKMELAGHKYNKLRVEGYWGRKGKHHHWNCICECGNKSVVSTSNLRQGHTKSCGCTKLKMENDGQFKNKKTKFIEKDDFYLGITDKGEEFKIDKEDYPKVKDFTWHTSTKGYLKTTIGGNKGYKKQIHRMILSPPDNMVVDHINHDKKDNRKANLRVCESFQNSYNRKSGKRGIYYRLGSYRVMIGHKNKRIHLGTYKTYEEALGVRLEAENKYYKEYAYNGVIR